VIELDPGYADVIVRRWQNYTGQTAQREQDGRSFEQIAAEQPSDQTSEPRETLV
jgi:hypothetical protein